MIEKISFRIFTTMMLLCAVLALVGIWFGESLPETFFKTIPTTFVIGLGSFLIWSPKIVYKFLSK